MRKMMYAGGVVAAFAASLAVAAPASAAPANEGREAAPHQPGDLRLVPLTRGPGGRS